MLRVAIVEDMPAELTLLQKHLQSYADERGMAFEFAVFGDATAFLERYRADYDIVFMDIELPGMDGMEAAHRLRALDRQVTLIFVTNMAQFAVKGYEVEALDYIVKPVKYGSFCTKLDRAVARCQAAAESIAIPQQNGTLRLLLREILYIEVNGHRLTYHTQQGTFEAGGSLQDVEAKLHPKGFLRCNKCYLVNQRQVRGMQGNLVQLSNGETLQISRLRKKGFLEELMDSMRDDIIV